MNSSPLLTPGLLAAVNWFVVFLTIVMTALHSAIFAGAAQRAGLSPSRQRTVTYLVPILLAAWAAWAVVAVSNPVVVPELAPTTNRPVVLLQMLPIFIAAVVAMYASRTLRAVNAATPPGWLIAIQTYRVAGAIFLWPYLAAGALPAGFALPAGIGDMLTGLAAPLVALAVTREWRGARQWAIAWNCFGLLDLIVAPTAAVLAHSTNVARFPLVIVPLFLGPPLGILTHLRSLQNLGADKHRQPNAAPAGAGVELGSI